ncbi:hypothetical protein JW721_00940 [Candidatus Micrarchaeota archaeon]|nr:hypothetical protein [Candidatus Micrarchaeota archaeon]
MQALKYCVPPRKSPCPPPVPKRPFGRSRRAPQEENIYGIGERTKLSYHIEEVSRLVYKMKFIRAEERTQEYGLSNNKFKLAIICAVLSGISNCTPRSIRRARKIAGFYGINARHLQKIARKAARSAIDSEDYSRAQKICKAFSLPQLLEKARFELVRKKIRRLQHSGAERSAGKYDFSKETFRIAAALAVEDNLQNGEYHPAAISARRYGLSGHLENASRLLLRQQVQEERLFWATVLAAHFNPRFVAPILRIMSGEGPSGKRYPVASALAKLAGYEFPKV